MACTYNIYKTKRKVMTKQCTKCKLVKNNSEFYFKNKDKGWLRPECKKCSIELTKARRKAKSDGYWYVYKILEDNYVGITSDFDSRKAVHKYKGKKTKTMKKIARYKRPEYAIIHEAILHLFGYNGCQLKPDGQ